MSRLSKEERATIRRSFNEHPSTKWETESLLDTCDALESEKAELLAALKNSAIALDDWLNTYASELSDADRVLEARKRICEKGTLAYIAELQVANRAAIERIRDEAHADALGTVLAALEGLYSQPIRQMIRGILGAPSPERFRLERELSVVKLIWNKWVKIKSQMEFTKWLAEYIGELSTKLKAQEVPK